MVKAALTEAAKKREMRYEDLRHIKKGVRRHFHDDITVVVIYLDQQRSKARLSDSKYLFTNAPPDIFSHNSDESGMLQPKKEASWDLFHSSSSRN